MTKQTSKTKINIGTQFHKLTVVKDIGRASNGSIVWGCICICGNVTSTNSSNLLQGRTKSCGCLRAESAAIRFSKPPETRGKNLLFSRYKRDAELRGIAWNLTKSKFLSITSQSCEYCGKNPSSYIGHVNPTETNYKGTYKYNGIDRVNPELGYVWSNVVPCCARCNLSKHVQHQSEFLSWIDILHERSCHV